MANKQSDETEFLERPYSDRQLIVVTDDEVIAATKASEKKAAKSGNSVNWGKLAEIGASVVIGGTGVLIAEVTKEAFNAWSRARANGLQIFQLGKTEARAINFPPGHPRDGVLYIGHPAISNVYYTTAEFHRIIFEHKFSEAVNLLMHLGATEIKVEHVTGWSKEFSSRISVPLGETGATASAEAGANKSSQSQLLYEASLPGDIEPALPTDLVWYPHEPTWQSIANGRLLFGLKDFSLSICYEDDFGINAGLKVAVQKSGLELGGKFEDHQSTIWRVAGKFKERR